MNMENQTDSYMPSGNMSANPADSSEQTSHLQFFSYPELTQCLDLINNLTENTKLIPLIVGQEGSGKTTLLIQLQSQAPKHWLFCRITANPMMHSEQLYDQLAKYFDIDEKDDQIKQKLLIHFESLRQDATLPIIAIDDAHLLPIDTVIELLQLHTTSASKYDRLLHIILFATPAISSLLQAQEAHAINSKSIQTLEIPSLTSEQAVAYITQKLITQDALETSTLTSDQIKKIARASRGLPGRVENLLVKLPAHLTTSQKQTEEPAFKSLTKGLPITAIIASIALISIISVLLLFQDEINAVFDEVHSDNAIIEDKSEVALELPALAEPKVEASQATEPLPQKITPVEELEPVLKIPEQPTVVAVSTSEAEIQPEVLEQELPVLEVDVDAQLSEIPAAQKPPATPKEITPATVTEPITTTELIPSIPKSVPAAPKTAAKPTVVKPDLKREAWLLSQDPTAYTLQVVGLRDESSLHEYIDRHKLTGEVAYFKTSRNNHSWYPLLYGIYPGRSVAMAAQVKLSAKLRQKDIWIRNIASVHEEINAQK